MTPKHFYILLLAVIAVGIAAAQNEDELQIPVENDNQFPPDNHSDTIEGSGEGVIDEPGRSVTTVTPEPPIEHIETKILLEDNGTASLEHNDGCPDPCVCHTDGSTSDFVIDCSGYGLTDIPSPLNEKVTILNIQNNKITEVPKQISSLTNLKVFNANDNSIKDLVPGSVSELPNLVTLKLGNNRLIEYPNELKNSFGLTKLQTLDLGGNDMRTTLTADMFSQFTSLKNVILPVSTTDLQENLCRALSGTLLKVCTVTCETEIYSCQYGTDSDDDIGYKLPGQLTPNDYDDSDPSIDTSQIQDALEDNKSEDAGSPTISPHDAISKENNENQLNGEFPFRSAVNKEPSDISVLSEVIIPNEVSNATTVTTETAEVMSSETKTGGVNKNIIGLVVAGMIVVVAVITIKKNWSSIRKRFSSNSNSRTPNERVDSVANGAKPEEVPLQDKSPV